MNTHIKSLLMILILTIFTAQHAAADNFSPEDMAFAFGDSAAVAADFGQMELLSSQEMMTTKGESFCYCTYNGYGYRMKFRGKPGGARDRMEAKHLYPGWYYQRASSGW